MHILSCWLCIINMVYRCVLIHDHVIILPFSASVLACITAECIFNKEKFFAVRFWAIYQLIICIHLRFVEIYGRASHCHFKVLHVLNAAWFVLLNYILCVLHIGEQPSNTLSIDWRSNSSSNAHVRYTNIQTNSHCLMLHIVQWRCAVFTLMCCVLDRYLVWNSSPTRGNFNQFVADIIAMDADISGWKLHKSFVWPSAVTSPSSFGDRK